MRYRENIRSHQTLHIVDIYPIQKLLDEDVREALPTLNMSTSADKVRDISDWIMFEKFNNWLALHKTRLIGHYRYDDAKLVMDIIKLPAVHLDAYLLPEIFTDVGKFTYTAMISGTSMLVSKELKR